MVLEDAVEQGIEACMNRGILEDILRKSKMEVRKMLLTEYDEKAEREYLRKEAIEMGLEEGRARGLEQGLEPVSYTHLVYGSFYKASGQGAAASERRQPRGQ